MKDIFVVFDVETGGLNSEVNPVLEIACIFVEQNENKDLIVSDKVKSIDYMILPNYLPDYQIEKDALVTNGINMSYIEKYGIPSRKFIDELLEKMQELNINNTFSSRKKNSYKNFYLVGHNISNFDVMFLEKMFQENGKNLYDYFNRALIDTYILSKMMFSKNDKIANLKLETVCNFLKIRLNNAHTAYGDAFANAQMFIKIYNFFQNENLRM
ncbi:MAG: 3'-5' exonuclease [Candidatus Woesearchaeota archaeon]